MKSKKEKIKLICNYCGKEHYLLECQLTRGRGKFCSKKCMDESRKNGDNLKCFHCGKDFYRAKAEQDLHLNKRQFCTKECYFNWRDKKSKSTTYKKIGSIHEHRIIAESVLKRKLKKNEIVHHIDENARNNSIDNLAVLPNQKIHAKIHFGKITEKEVQKYCLINLIKK